MASSQTAASSTLTPAIVIKTTVPFPVPLTKQGDKPINNIFDDDSWSPHESRKVVVETCSELMDYQYPLDVFSVATSQKVRANDVSIVHDKAGQQMVFTIGGEQRLYALFYVQNATEGWQAIDITPPAPGTALVDAFDVVKHNTTIYVVAAVRIGETASVRDENVKVPTNEIWWSSFKEPELVGMDQSNQVGGFSAEDLKWRRIINNRGEKSITTLKCAAPTDDRTPFWLTAGTSATKTETATYYTISTDPESQGPWQPVSLAEGSDAILKILPAALGSSGDDKLYPAAVTLYQRQSDAKQSCTVDRLDDSRSKRQTTRVLETEKLGQLCNVTTSTTDWGASDLFIASEKGIGYFSSEEVEVLHSVILPEISFQQVVAAEVTCESEEDPEIFSRFNVLGVSEDGGLYFIRGTRYYDKTLKFLASGIPIRSDVRMLAATFNASVGTNEVVYVPNAANEICHLAQDPISSLWNEVTISVKSPTVKTEFIRQKAFVTTLTLTDDDDVPVPDGYPLEITSEAVQVSIDSKSFSLSAKPTIVRTTGGRGQISIVARSHGLLGASDYHIKLTAFAADAPSARFDVQPSQRVARIMSSIKSASDLSNAKDNEGRPIFSGLDAEKLGVAADVISGATSATNGQPDTSSKSTVVSCERGSDGVQKVSTDEGWFSKTTKAVGNFLGDVIEGLKIGTKFIVKCALKVVGPVVRFVIKYGGKILSFALKGVGMILRGVCGILKELGIATEAMERWVSFLFDGTSTEKTQKAIADVIQGGLGLCGRVLKENRDSLSDLLFDARQKLKQYVDDPRQVPESDAPKKKSFFAKLLDNPIIKALLKFNPLSWIIEAITEEVDTSSWTMPNLKKFQELLSKHAVMGVEGLVNCIYNILEALVVGGGDAITNPSKFKAIVKRVFQTSAWELFDAVETVALSLYDMLIDVFDLLFEFLTGEWVIPGLTDLWEDLTGQSFSILGFITYIPAVMLNLTTMLINGKLPFDGMPAADFSRTKIPRFYKSDRPAATPKTNDITVRMTQVPDWDHAAIQAQPFPQPTHDKKASRVWKEVFLAMSELIGVFITMKEIVNHADYRPAPSGGPPSQLKILNPTAVQPATGLVNQLADLPHTVEVAALVFSAGCRLAYTVIRLSDGDSAPRAALWCSFVLDCTAVAVTKSPTASIVAMQAASGVRAVAETVHSGLHLSHWSHHLTEGAHIVGAVAAIGAVASRKVGHLEWAVPLAILDLGVSVSAGVGGIVYACLSEEEGKKHQASQSQPEKKV